MKTLKQFLSEDGIANITGGPATDTNGISNPATASPNNKKKVMLLKTVRRKQNSEN